MAWPSWQDFNDAVQTPASSFTDPDLVGAAATTNAMGLPVVCSGNYAVVYQMRSPDLKRQWAVKCFTKQVTDRHQRYRAISSHLQQADLPFAVDFTYLEQGIRIKGQWYPIAKMDWVEGQTLSQFVSCNLDRPARLEHLSNMWLKLAKRLRQTQITHGDLQHGNVLLVPDAQENKLSLRLVDYDGMYVPTLAQLPSGELGLPAYQHPQRSREKIYGPEVDRFSHLVIYTALRALKVHGPSLWQRFDTGENLLFTSKDYTTPGNSKLLHELWTGNREDLRNLTGRLVLAAQGELRNVPELGDLVTEDAVAPLAGREQDQVDQILKPRTMVKVQSPITTVQTVTAVKPPPLVRPPAIKRSGTSTKVYETVIEREEESPPAFWGPMIGGGIVLVAAIIGLIIFWNRPTELKIEPAPNPQALFVDGQKQPIDGPDDINWDPRGKQGLPNEFGNPPNGDPPEKDPPFKDQGKPQPVEKPPPNEDQPPKDEPPPKKLELPLQGKPGDERAINVFLTNGVYTGVYTLLKSDPIDTVKRRPGKIFLVNLEAGRTYVIDQQVQGQQVQGKAIDPYLRLEDLAGAQLASDDDGGGFPNARIQYNVTQTRTYRIVATSFGGGEGAFTLKIRDNSALAVAGAGNARNVIDVVTIPEKLTNFDRIGNDNRRYKEYSFFFEADTTYIIHHASSQFDAFLRLLTSTGALIRDDDDGGGGLNSQITFRPGKAGVYLVQPTTLRAGQIGAFTLTVRRVDVPAAAASKISKYLSINIKTGRATENSALTDAVTPGRFNIVGRPLIRHTFEVSANFTPKLALYQDPEMTIPLGLQSIGKGGACQYDYTPTNSNPIYIQVGSADGRTGAYTLTVRRDPKKK